MSSLATHDVNTLIKKLETQLNHANLKNADLASKCNELQENRQSLEEEYLEKIRRIRKSNEIEMSHLLEQMRFLEKDYGEKIRQLTLEKERFTKEYQTDIKESARGFLDATVHSLREREAKLSRISNLWSILGVSVLLLGSLLIVIISFSNSEKISQSISWAFLVYYLFKGVTILTIVGFFARYTFMQSGNYMREALKIDNRIHGIKFGQLYIITYGASAEWTEVKEALSSWNGAEGQTNWMSNIDFDELIKNVSSLTAILNKKQINEEGEKETSQKEKEKQ